jgi:hypothetical protein
MSSIWRLPWMDVVPGAVVVEVVTREGKHLLGGSFYPM